MIGPQHTSLMQTCYIHTCMGSVGALLRGNGVDLTADRGPTAHAIS